MEWKGTYVGAWHMKISSKAGLLNFNATKFFKYCNKHIIYYVDYQYHNHGHYFNKLDLSDYQWLHKLRWINSLTNIQQKRFNLF